MCLPLPMVLLQCIIFRPLTGYTLMKNLSFVLCSAVLNYLPSPYGVYCRMHGTLDRYLRNYLPSPYGVHCAECQEQCISFCGLTLPSPYGVYHNRGRKEVCELTAPLPSPYGVYLECGWQPQAEMRLLFRPLTGCTCKNIQKAAAKHPVNQPFSTGTFLLYHNLNQKGIPQSK